MAFTNDKLRSSGRVFLPQDRLGVFLSEVASHTKDGDARQTEVNPFAPDFQEGYGSHFFFYRLTNKVEFARLAISMLHESPVGQQHHSDFASTLRHLGEALSCISDTYAGIEGLLWDRELRESAQESRQGLQPLFKLLPPRSTRLALLENSERQDMVHKMAVWASNEDALRRLQSELTDGIRFIRSRLDLIKREYHDHTPSATDTVSEDADTATCTDPSKAATVTELSSIASFANATNGVARCDKSSSSSASIAASRRQRSSSDPISFQDGPQGADPNGSHHWLQKGIGGGTRSVSCGEVSDRGDEAQNLSHGRIPRFNCAAPDLASLGPANDCTIGSWTGSSHALLGNLEMLVPTSLELDIKLESEGISSCVGQGSQANQQPSLGECGRLGSGCNTIEGMFWPRIEVCPQMADQLNVARHSRSYSMGRWLQCRCEDPWSPARPTGKWCLCRTDNSSNLPGPAKSQKTHGQAHPAGCDNLRVEAIAALGLSDHSEDDSIAPLFEGLSLRRNIDRKGPPNQPVCCTPGAQESPATPSGSRGNLGPSDNVRGRRKADQSNSNGDNGDGNSGDRDGDSGGGGGPGKRRRHQSPQPKNSAGYPCIYRDTLGVHCGQRWKTVKKLKVHLKSRHGLSREDMDVGRGGTEEEKWKRLYEKLRGQPAPHPLKWMLDTLLEPMQQLTDDSHSHYDHSRPGDDSWYSEQISSVPLGELVHTRFVASSEVAPPMSQSVPFDQINNAHDWLSLNGTIHPWVSHTKSHMLQTNQSDALERAHDYRPPMYGYDPVEAAGNQWQPTTAMYASTSDPRFEELMFEGCFPCTSTLGEKSLSEAPQVDTGLVTDTSYLGSDTRSQSAPNSWSNPSLFTAPTSLGEIRTGWEGSLADLEWCTCVQHIPSCVDDFNTRKCLCWGCGRMMPARCVPGIDATLRVCQ